MDRVARWLARAPRRCPACLRDEGKALSVTLEHGLRTVVFVCGACRHQWEETTRALDALFLDNP